ncbi:hypothetical protein GEOBRER4_n2995 [Citrifermentans bremense]|uniref:Uncharacterized protein n=1 Tax=Citrifermentans bremense TaxID=60035 RepID=A0A7R7FTL2_9BACT|nr:hypothetical protein GEOBRER4_n2995 [Citrifermentans bremense]
MMQIKKLMKAWPLKVQRSQVETPKLEVKRGKCGGGSSQR